MELHVEIARKVYPAVAKAKQHVAIENLNFSLASGEFVCMVGPSGCGKTTLLNILAGLDRDFAGEIRVIHGEKRNPAVGYVFQEPRLLPWRTVRENIDLVLQPQQDPAPAEHLLKVMGLEHVQHVYPPRLSLGMSRRVALVRAFAIEPDLLLMDEPFVSLDAPTARRIRKLLIAVWRERPHTVLFVTHDLREAIALADRVLFLSTHPARLLNDIRVGILRDERDDERKCENFRRSLLADYAELRHLL